MVANIDIPIGCASRRAASRSPFPHGGARNFATRQSECLTAKQVDRLIHATERAAQIGRPLNRFTTVHWEAAGISDSEAMKATTAYLKYLREWLGGETAYVWTRENGGGKGSHVHILWHLPAGQRLHGSRPRQWVERIAGHAYQSRWVKTRQVMGWRDPDGELYLRNLRGVLGYLIKGAVPSKTVALGIRHESGGVVTGKRCGASRNLGSNQMKR